MSVWERAEMDLLEKEGEQNAEEDEEEEDDDDSEGVVRREVEEEERVTKKSKLVDHLDGGLNDSLVGGVWGVGGRGDGRTKEGAKVAVDVCVTVPLDVLPSERDSLMKGEEEEREEEEEEVT